MSEQFESQEVSFKNALSRISLTASFLSNLSVQDLSNLGETFNLDLVRDIENKLISLESRVCDAIAVKHGVVIPVPLISAKQPALVDN